MYFELSECRSDAGKLRNIAAAAYFIEQRKNQFGADENR